MAQCLLKISKRLVFKTLLEASLVRIQKQVVSLAQVHLGLRCVFLTLAACGPFGP
jgi:hypothetical protein